MLTTLVASVGAGGIPSGSFVTMPLIFAAVRLPVDKIPILLTVDWLLDRCRTTSNVLGDMTVAVLLDRVSPPSRLGWMTIEPAQSPKSVLAFSDLIIEPLQILGIGDSVVGLAKAEPGVFDRDDRVRGDAARDPGR